MLHKAIIQFVHRKCYLTCLTRVDNSHVLPYVKVEFTSVVLSGTLLFAYDKEGSKLIKTLFNSSIQGGIFVLY